MALPAEGDLSVLGVVRRRPRFEVGDVEVGERVVDEAVHRAGLAEHVEVDEPGDEVRREGDHEGLQRQTESRRLNIMNI